MELTCKLCSKQFVSTLVGVSKKESFAEVWRAINLHIAKDHPEKAQPESALLVQVAQAMAACRAFSMYIVTPEATTENPLTEDQEFMLDIWGKQYEVVTEFLDGTTPTPDVQRVVPVTGQPRKVV